MLHAHYKCMEKTQYPKLATLLLDNYCVGDDKLQTSPPLEALSTARCNIDDETYNREGDDDVTGGRSLKMLSLCLACKLLDL